MITTYSITSAEAARSEILINGNPISFTPYLYFKQFPYYNIIKIDIPGRDASEDLIFNLYELQTPEEKIIQSNNEKIFRMYCIKAGHTEETANALIESVKQFFQSQIKEQK